MKRRVRGGLGFFVCVVLVLSFFVSIGFFVEPVQATTAKFGYETKGGSSLDVASDIMQGCMFNSGDFFPS